MSTVHESSRLEVGNNKWGTDTQEQLIRTRSRWCRKTKVHHSDMTIEHTIVLTWMSDHYVLGQVSIILISYG